MLAIDEISMASKYLLEYIDNVLKGAKENNEPFSGIQIIAAGDFFQFLPVIEKQKCPYLKVCKCNLNITNQRKCKKGHLYSIRNNSKILCLSILQKSKTKMIKYFYKAVDRFEPINNKTEIKQEQRACCV